MINLETDKRMEAVKESATVIARSKDNQDRIQKLYQEISRLQD